MDHRVNQPGPDDGTPGSWEWNVCGASVTGSQHLTRGLGCDDAFAYGVSGDFVVAVVADGAGSVSGTSAWGSFTACQSVLAAAMTNEFVDSFRTAAPKDGYAIMRWLFEGALAAVTARAEELGLSLPQLSTTLCVALARPGLTVFGQIGDGIIAAENAGEIGTLLIENKNDYANATWFIQSHGAFDESFRIAVPRDVSAFALSTDGMAYKITNIATGEAYEPFFRGSWDNVNTGASAADFAALLRSIEDDQTGDDKTMVLAVLQWQPDRFYPSAQPLQKMTVTSPPPPWVPAAPGPAGEPTPDASQTIVDHGALVDLLDAGLTGAQAPLTDSPRSQRRHRLPAPEPHGRERPNIDVLASRPASAPPPDLAGYVEPDETPTIRRRRSLGRRGGN
jgi:hypothetical protein